MGHPGDVPSDCNAESANVVWDRVVYVGVPDASCYVLMSILMVLSKVRRER